MTALDAESDFKLSNNIIITIISKLFNLTNCFYCSFLSTSYVYYVFVANAYFCRIPEEGVCPSGKCAL
jgi:hypothetical protein